jgi:hypothetical protein
VIDEEIKDCPECGEHHDGDDALCETCFIQANTDSHTCDGCRGNGCGECGGSGEIVAFIDPRNRRRGFTITKSVEIDPDAATPFVAGEYGERDYRGHASYLPWAP